MADNLVIPGQGWVFTGSVDAAPPDIATFDETKLDKFGTGWNWLGSTSKDNLVSLSKDGGDVETIDTWDTPSVRSSKATETWSMTINAVSIQKEVLELAFPGGKWDASTNSYQVAAKNGTVSKAILVVMRDDESGLCGIYMPNGALSIGDAPELDAESFFEIQLNAVAQASPTTKSPLTIFVPRAAKASSSSGS